MEARIFKDEDGTLHYQPAKLMGGDLGFDEIDRRFFTAFNQTGMDATPVSLTWKDVMRSLRNPMDIRRERE